VDLRVSTVKIEILVQSNHMRARIFVRKIVSAVNGGCEIFMRNDKHTQYRLNRHTEDKPHHKTKGHRCLRRNCGGDNAWEDKLLERQARAWRRGELFRRVARQRLAQKGMPSFPLHQYDMGITDTCFAFMCVVYTNTTVFRSPLQVIPGIEASSQSARELTSSWPIDEICTLLSQHVVNQLRLMG